MASKSKASRSQASKVEKRVNFYLIAIPVLAFVIKLITMANIPGGFWLGADGENYVTGLDALIKDGIFSTERLLSYWPAGYPLLMLILAKITIEYALLLMVLLQSTLFGFASWYFTRAISKTKINKYVLPIALILSFNPTLSLSTLTVGYESISAAIFILVIGLFINEYQSNDKRAITKKSLLASALLSLSIFVQPRFILSALALFIIWALVLKPKKSAVLFLAVTTMVISVLPASLVLRNIKANDFAAISTNLGLTMNLGAGPGATGAYIKEGYGVPCEPIEGNAAVQDAHLRNCVLSWYIKNPVKSVELFYNKARFFWSPWFGPAGSGSMARNPWLRINPLVSIATESQSGNKLVFGTFGKLISWAWMLALILFAGFGAFKLWQAGGLSRHIASSVGLIILLNWFISIGTLGDHRQRLPIMTLTLFLQVVGFFSLINRKKYNIAKSENSATQSRVL